MDGSSGPRIVEARLRRVVVRLAYLFHIRSLRGLLHLADDSLEFVIVVRREPVDDFDINVQLSA
jgi:hypothetical protein